MCQARRRSGEIGTEIFGEGFAHAVRSGARERVTDRDGPHPAVRLAKKGEPRVAHELEEGVVCGAVIDRLHQGGQVLVATVGEGGGECFVSEARRARRSLPGGSLKEGTNHIGGGDKGLFLLITVKSGWRSHLRVERSGVSDVGGTIEAGHH